MDQKRLEEFVPTQETENEPFQVDKYRNFRIVVKGRIGYWTSSDKIASIVVDGVTYIGVSDRFKDILPVGRILKIEEVDEDGETGFYQFKIAGIVEDRILDEDDVLDILRDPMYDEDYNITVKAARRKDFVKIRIVEFAPLGIKPDIVLGEEEVIDFLIDAFDPFETDVYNTKGDIINKGGPVEGPAEEEE